MNIISIKDEGSCIKIYDPSKQELIECYLTRKKAAQTHCITEKVLIEVCKSKKRVFSKTLNKDISIRVGKIEEGMKFNIHGVLQNIKTYKKNAE